MYNITYYKLIFALTTITLHIGWGEAIVGLVNLHREFYICRYDVAIYRNSKTQNGKKKVVLKWEKLYGTKLAHTASFFSMFIEMYKALTWYM